METTRDPFTVHSDVGPLKMSAAAVHYAEDEHASDDGHKKSLVAAEEGSVVAPMPAASGGQVGFGGIYGGTGAASDFVQDDYDMLMHWMYRVNGCYQCQCL